MKFRAPLFNELKCNLLPRQELFHLCCLFLRYVVGMRPTSLAPLLVEYLSEIAERKVLREMQHAATSYSHGGIQRIYDVLFHKLHPGRSAIISVHAFAWERADEFSTCIEVGKFTHEMTYRKRYLRDRDGEVLCVYWDWDESYYLTSKGREG